MANFHALSRDTSDLHAEFVDAKPFRFIVMDGFSLLLNSRKLQAVAVRLI
jgi:hypothetical protein